jgi:uncharacterized protein YigA (DUF484 family)
VDEDAIREYLSEHPDFLQRHSDLLGILQVPHPSGAAISLVERQVSVLRERNVDLRHRLRDLASNARSNDQLFAGTRALVLSLLGADSPVALERALLRVLHESFDTEYAALLLYGNAEPGSALRHVSENDARSRLGPLLRSRGSGCGVLRADDFAFLFRDARLVGSAAITQIDHDGRALGLFAVGSSDARRYDGDMGTLFLEFTAEVLGHMLARFDAGTA